MSEPSTQIPIDGIPLNIAVYRYSGDDFIIVDFNAMAEKTDNIRKEDVVGKRLTEVFPGVKAFGLFDVLLRVHEKGGHEECELGFYEDERISGWRQNRVCRLPNGDVAALYQDMTKEKSQAEDDLNQKQHLQSLGYIVDNSMSEVYIFDKVSLRFTYVNQKAQKNSGYTLDEFKEMTPVDIKSDYTMRSFLLLLEPLLDGSKKELVFETRHRRKDGNEYDVEVHLQRMEVGGTEQFVVMAYDISDRKSAQSQLQESEEKFRTIAENALMGIFIYHEHYVYVNQAFAAMSGYTAEELFEMEPWELMETSCREKLKQVVERRLDGECFSQEYSDIKIVTKNGQLKTVRIMTQTIRYKGRYAGMGTIMDITDILETEQQLKLLAQAIEQMDTLVRITDKEGIITYVNDALVAHTGYRQAELIGKKVGMFKSGHHDRPFYKNLWKTILSGKSYHGVFTNMKKDRQLYYEEEIITPMMDGENDIQHFVATSQDITERFHMEERLNKLATIDSLTGIYNRHKTNAEIDIELGRAKRYNGAFALAMFDIDDFKAVNDTYGHDIGDHVLRELSGIISNHIRVSDRFGRWGGEEFMLILPKLTEKEAINVTQKLRKIVEKHLFIEVPKITISIGVTVFKQGDTKEKLLKRVDDALYQAKEKGRNRVILD